jgi:hypothetical protein
MFRMAGASFVRGRGSFNRESEDVPMATNTSTPGALNLTLDSEEVTELLHILEHALGETRVEVHHTHSPDYRAQVQHREAILRRLIDKFKKAGS